MVLFALPHMLTSALQIAYSAVDLAIVGHAVSGAALSAVSVSGHVLNLVTMLGLGFSTGRARSIWLNSWAWIAARSAGASRQRF